MDDAGEQTRYLNQHIISRLEPSAKAFFLLYLILPVVRPIPTSAAKAAVFGSKIDAKGGHIQTTAGQTLRTEFAVVIVHVRNLNKQVNCDLCDG
eukprot:scaffold256089_cov43-Prasinocladus_malaysianus.AAC.1